MSRLRAIKATLAAAAAVCSLGLVASAGAATWQGPAQISAVGGSLGDTSGQIALGARGDAGAAWWDDGAGGRFELARRLAGTTWSAQVTIASGVPQSPIFVGVDGTGGITAAYVTPGPVWNIATWASGAAAPTTAPLTVTLPRNITDLAVNAKGDAVLSGLTGDSLMVGVTVAYRQGATAPFALHTYAAPISGGEASSAKVAINADGMAVVAMRAADALVAATRKTVADWPANVETVRGTGVQDADPTVAIDAAGNVFSAFTYDAGGGVMIVRTGYRPGGGGWQESQNLSPATAGSVASFPDVALNAPGAALLVWKQVGTGLNNVSGRLGTTGTGIWGPIETVNAFGPDVPVAAIADNGIAVAAWEHDTGGNNVDQARVRSAGAAGTWGDIHDLDALHANDTAVSLSADGPGDFATISAPFSAALAYKPALVSVYDAAPPVVTPAVTGNLSAGGTVTLAATATDAWSTAGTPAWAFGDGGSGAGSSVPHVYSAAGTYTAHVTVSDASGNTFGTDVPVVVKEAAKATLVGAKFRAKWKQSRVSGTLFVTGTTPITGTYAFNISKGTTRKIHVSLKLNAGPFSRSIRLPVKFLPGVYHVAIAPVSKIIKPATLDATLAAPVEGVVDTVKLTRTRKAESARFHFAAVPKTGKLTLSWYRLVKGKRARLASASKARKATVTGSLSLSRQHGSFVVVLTRAGKVIAQTAFKIR